METPSKVCYKCKKHKPTTDFHKDNSREDGLRYICKECVSTRKVCDMDCFHCKLPDCINNNVLMTAWEKEAIRNYLD